MQQEHSIVCYEKWNLERLEHIKALILPKEVGRQVRKIQIEPDVPRLRVRYATKKGDRLSRVYGNLVYHGPAYKKRKVQSGEGYVYESVAHPIEDEYNAGSSLQTLPVWIRRLLAHEHYRDFDLCNCAPVLLQQILEKEGVAVPTPLSHYNTQRTALYEKYSTVATPKEIKTAFLEVIHMGEVNPKFRETAALKTSLRSTLLLLSRHSTYYADLYIACINKVSTKQKYGKLSAYSKVTKALGKFCAIVWQRQEHCVLMVMRRFFTEKLGYNPLYMALCFDGIMLEKDKQRDETVNLDALSAYVLKETGYTVQIVEKSLTPSTDDWDIYHGKRLA